MNNGQSSALPGDTLMHLQSWILIDFYGKETLLLSICSLILEENGCIVTFILPALFSQTEVCVLHQMLDKTLNQYKTLQLVLLLQGERGWRPI